MIRRRVLVLLVAFFLLSPALAVAQNTYEPGGSNTSAGGFTAQIVPPSCDQNGGCSSICNLAQLAQNVLNDGIYLAVFLSAILFAWAGWKHMTASGNMSQIHQANEVFKNVMIGLIIILSAWLIVDTIIGALGGAPSGHLPWNQICQ